MTFPPAHQLIVIEILIFSRFVTISALLKNISCVQNLPDKDLVGKSDPYAKVYLIGDNAAQINAEDKHTKTKTHKNNLNPEFNDIFKFKVMWQCHENSCSTWWDGKDLTYRPHMVFTFFLSIVKLLRIFNCLPSQCNYNRLMIFMNCWVRRVNVVVVSSIFVCCMLVHAHSLVAGRVLIICGQQQYPGTTINSWFSC